MICTFLKSREIAYPPRPRFLYGNGKRDTVRLRSNFDGTMARFPDAREAVNAHYRWFLQPRYTDARNSDDPVEQAQMIFDAGYAADPNWISGVESLVGRNAA